MSYTHQLIDFCPLFGLRNASMTSASELSVRNILTDFLRNFGFLIAGISSSFSF
jgi:hypothetical protein